MEAVKPTYAWRPQLGPQTDAIRTAFFCEELFYGGARGGGKSDYLLGDYASDLDQGAAWQGILFRKSYPELDELVRRSLEIYPGLGGEYKVGAHNWVWPNGAVLKFRHIETMADAAKYQGHSYAWIGFDELPNWPTDEAYHMLKATLRGPADAKRIRATGNPGGVGHAWVKQYFVDPAPDGYELIEDGKTTRMFIPAKVQDNQILMRDDPQYVDRLKQVGDDQLVKAWLEGDWDVLMGQFFNTWRREEVVVPSFSIPPTWALFGAMDYGESNPTSFGLYAVDYDDTVYRISEYYLGDRAASQHAEAIRTCIEGCPHTKERDSGKGRWPQRIYADPSMWTKRRLTEQISKSPADIFKEQGVFLTQAKNDRVNGWRVCRDALHHKRFKLFDGWNDHFIRTVPTLPRDANNPEDLDTKAEDHAADEWRYLMVHEYRAPEPDRTPYEGTAQQIIDQLTSKRQKRGQRRHTTVQEIGLL